MTRPICMPLVVTTTDVMFKNFFGFDGLTIGLGAGKFWEVLRIFARIFPNLSEKKLHEKVTSKTKLYVILGAISAPYFQRFCQDFHGFFADFIWFCPDFTESKCLGVLLHPPASYTSWFDKRHVEMDLMWLWRYLWWFLLVWCFNTVNAN